MVDEKEEFEPVYIVNTPFTGNEEEIAATFLMESVETETNENSCIMTDEGKILVQNVCDVTEKDYTQIVDKEYAQVVDKEYAQTVDKEYKQVVDKEYKQVVDKEFKQIVDQEYTQTVDKEYTQILESDLQQDQEMEEFDMIADEDNTNDELDKNEALEDESIFLGTNKRKRVPESTSGHQYQPAEPVIPNGVEVDEFTCPYCLKAFRKVSNKKNHMRLVHNVSFRSKGRSKGFIKCNECDIEFLLVNKLRQHLREVHGMAMGQEIHRFPNMESFKLWKRNLERNENEFFIQQYGPKKNKLGIKWGYLCHRSGKYVPPQPYRKRMCRNQGSFKMGMYCTSAISIQERSNEVVVVYWPQHYGHAKEMSTKHLSNQEQSTLEESISGGGTFSDILRNCRENAISTKIVHMALKRRNIQVLKAAFESEEYNPGLTDSESVDRWVNHCLQLDDSPVLYYKQEELESGEGEFLLVIMTEFQKQLLASSDKKVVCVDCVHRKKGGRFYLTCISIMDECDVAFPVGFCISDKIDATVVRSFLGSIRDSTGPLSCTYFMSDNEPYYFEAWKEVMGDNSKWLWSMWYFDYNIHIQLRFFRNDVLKKAEAYRTLKTLTECRDQGIFETMFKKFVNLLMADPDSRKLGDYLLKRYGTTTKHWAYCYRTDLKPTTNFQLDVMHRTLRYCCREGRKKRLDKFIFVLMKFLKMKMLDRLTTILDEEKIQMVIETINECHREGLDVPSEAISSLSDKIWLIKSADEYENVYVTRDYNSCPDRCKLRCSECDICIHMYSCSCIPSMINANLCQHIHAVVWKFLTPHFSPAHLEVVGSDDEDTDSCPALEEGLEMLDCVLRKTHDVYKKIRNHKWDLNNDSLNVILGKLEDLEHCIETCAENRGSPTIERLQAKVKQEFNSNSNEPSPSQNDLGSNPNKTSLPFVMQQQPLNSIPPPIFYLPNQSGAVPQNGQTAQPYILIIPHDAPNIATIPK